MNRFVHFAGPLQRAGAQAVLRAAALCDGHRILQPQALLDAGLPPELVNHATVLHRSGDAPKARLYARGQPVPELRGVDGLELLRLMAQALGVSYPACFGRGSQARAIRAALAAHFQADLDPGPTAA